MNLYWQSIDEPQRQPRQMPTILHCTRERRAGGSKSTPTPVYHNFKLEALLLATYGQALAVFKPTLAISRQLWTKPPSTQHLLYTVWFRRRSLECGFTSLAGRTDSPRGSLKMESSASGERVFPREITLRNIVAHGFTITSVVVIYDTLLLLHGVLF